MRVITASNRDLEQEVSQGRFREDLFYRLNVVRIDVPPLSDRREDIPLLVDFFIHRHWEGLGSVPEFTKEAMDLLIGAQWAGNVRELENEVLRALAMSTKGQPITPDDLSPRISGDKESSEWAGEGTLKERVDNFEKIIISRILSECQGNATHSAKLLGISRAGLYKKLDKHGLMGKR